MNASDIINHLIERYGYRHYLEIGIFYGYCFDKVKCENKDGVDPTLDENCIVDIKYLCTSDEFFANRITKKYDIIFIDGLHEENQVDKDIVNSINWLTTDGTIVLHDCNAPSQEGCGEGTVWRSVSKFNCTDNGYSCRVVDTDHGVGIIRKEPQAKSNLSLAKAVEWGNRQLNLISIEDFKQLYNKSILL